MHRRSWPLAVLLSLLVQAGCSPSRSLEALFVLEDVAAGAEASRLKAKTPAPVRRTVDYTFEGHADIADVYRPGGGVAAKAVVVLVPGVVRLGKNDPRLVAFANTLARARFLVFVPDLANLRRLSIGSEDAGALARAIRYAVERSGVGERSSVGVVAFSYAAGPALLAAMSEEARHHVRFVYAVGAYYNLDMVVAYLTTGHHRQDAASPWVRSEPSPYALWVFIRSCAARLENEDDRLALTAAADAKLADPDADISDAMARLGPEGRAVIALIGNSDPMKAADLIAGLPAPVLAELRALDLAARDLAALEARVILIHGRDDRLIPYTESAALAAAIPGGRASLSIIGSLEHVDLQLSNIGDAISLWLAIGSLLEERDRMPRPSWSE